MRYVLCLVLISTLAACRRGGPVPDLPGQSLGSCEYTNSFSKRGECRDYFGDWTEKRAKEDCAGWGGTLVVGVPCDDDVRLGYCVIGEKGVYTRVTFPGDNASKCGSSRTGCEVFGGGIFDPSPLCGAAPEDSSLGLATFQQPIRTCMAPKAGEAPGQGPNGQVCTWEMISGSTELGRDFGDYASCDRVRTQRPYYAAPTEADATRDDPRLQDPAYAADITWMKQQITSSACVCCHSTRAPEGTSNWYVDQPGNFLNGFYGSGLAMGAGWINSVGFGTYPPEDNNGFSRPTEANPDQSIVPTTDPARMKSIFERELAFRGLTRADFADQPYAAGPLDEQRFYRPSRCERGEGVASDGTITWSGGGARYLYVLEAEANSPTVPPNLDLPQGTLWRVDVAFSDEPFKEASYGNVPSGASQRFPVDGSPAPLVSGRDYYLYVTADIAIPITRCLFTAP